MRPVIRKAAMFSEDLWGRVFLKYLQWGSVGRKIRRFLAGFLFIFHGGGLFVTHQISSLTLEGLTIFIQILEKGKQN